MLALGWRLSRDSGVALIVHPTVCTSDFVGAGWRRVPPHTTAIEWQRFKVEGQRSENARRDRATLEVCELVLMGYVEGRRYYAEKIAAGFGDFLTRTLIAEHSGGTYEEMRNFLMGELDAHPVIAATAARRAADWCNPRRNLKQTYAAWEGQ